MSNIINHGNGLKTKWKIKVSGKAPPNPPLEVRFNGTEWEIFQHRSERVLDTFGDHEDTVGAAIDLAIDHRTELSVKDEGGAILWETSYR